MGRAENDKCFSEELCRKTILVLKIRERVWQILVITVVEMGCSSVTNVPLHSTNFTKILKGEPKKCL